MSEQWLQDMLSLLQESETVWRADDSCYAQGRADAYEHLQEVIQLELKFQEETE